MMRLRFGTILVAVVALAANAEDETTKVLKTAASGNYVCEEVRSLPVVCCEVRAVEGREASLLPNGKKFKLVWHDEFDGTALDESKWSYRTNFWGRRAHWFAAPEDGCVEVADGKLHLKLKKLPNGQFVSPQLQTGELVWDVPHVPNPSGFWPLPKREKPKFVHKYGYYECRCRLQKMPGWWSAFWMQSEQQGCSLDQSSSGIEHDIMESFDPGEVIVAAFHMNGYGPDYRGFHIPAGYDEEPKFEGKLNLAVDTESFHTFGLLWEPDGYSIYVDGRLRGRNDAAVSHVPEFLLLTTEAKWYRNNRMTGKAVPELEVAAAAGDDFVVDYVRVYDIETAANIAEYPGEVGEKTGWKCVGSDEGKVVYIPFEGYYESKGGRIESPRFKLDGEIGKNRFYRLTFSAKCLVDGYWWVDFFDAEGSPLPDVNSRLYAADDWTPYDVMVPARPDAAFAQIAFVTKKGARAKDVSIRQATVAEAAKWCSDLAVRLPKLDAPETKGAWDGLQKARAKILSGKSVNIVFLGDSIMNDTWCGNAVALIQDALPQTDLRCYLSVRGSTGCWYYHEKDHFAEYVGKYKPDLVVIGGISNYGGPAYHSLKEVEDCMVETILRCQLIGAEVVICTPPPSYEFRKDAAAKPFDRSLVLEDGGFLHLQQKYERRAAQRAGAQVWDLTTAPCEAIARSGKPLDWFKRDAAHNDDRGKQLIAQTLAAYFRTL